MTPLEQAPADLPIEVTRAEFLSLKERIENLQRELNRREADEQIGPDQRARIKELLRILNGHVRREETFLGSVGEGESACLTRKKAAALHRHSETFLQTAADEADIDMETLH